MTHPTDQGGAGDGPDTRLRAVAMALREGDMARASELAIAALAAGDEHPAFLNLRALRLEESGRLDDALADLERARILAPGDHSIPNAIGLCLARMNRMAEAVAAFDASIAMAPTFAPAHFNRGWALEPSGDLTAARAAYERAAELEPRHAEAWAHLAQLAARRGDLPAARTLADKALALRPGQPLAELARATAELGEREGTAAIGRLRMLVARADIGPLERAMAQGQLADALDAQGATEEAFAAYVASNAALQALNIERFGPGASESVSEMLARLDAYFARAPATRWRANTAAATPGDEAIGHVFLLSFPRSGTTLMEQAIGAHPDVVALEERETLAAALRAFMTEDRGLDRLADLDDAALQPYRDDYWRVVRAHGLAVEGKVFLDKNPFNTAKLPLIAKLFPRAKILFAIRDPRDVVFSCFRRRFAVNASTYEFLTLDGAARAYDLTMRLAERFRRDLSLAWRDIVYERMVEDFDASRQEVSDFIGLRATDDLGDVTARARAGAVATASSAQVSRNVNREGVGQWRRYADEMAAVRGLLAPWVQRYGYPRD